MRESEELAKRLDQHRHTSPHKLRKLLENQGKMKMAAPLMEGSTKPRDPEEVRLDRHADVAWSMLGCIVASVCFGAFMWWVFKDRTPEPQTKPLPLAIIGIRLEKLQNDLDALKLEIGPIPVEQGSWPTDLRPPIDAAMRAAIREVYKHMLEGETLTITIVDGLPVWDLNQKPKKPKRFRSPFCPPVPFPDIPKAEDDHPGC